MYFFLAGEYYRSLLMQPKAGVWAICLRGTSAPVYFTDELMQQNERVAITDIARLKPYSDTQRKKMQVIDQLTRNEQYIYDQEKRAEKVKEIAESASVSPKTVQRMLYRYWTTGSLSHYLVFKKEKEKEMPATEAYSALFHQVIQKFYFSAAKMSLRDAYDQMLFANFVSQETGAIDENAPSFSQFRNFYYRNEYQYSPRKAIARDGLTAYQRNERRLYGSSQQWRPSIGCFQIDNTMADIYLVSRYDRKLVARPYIFVAVDVASQLITGVHVGFECNENATLACLYSCVRDKVALCAEYGIEIAPEDWPGAGLPSELVTDKGREFLGGRLDELVLSYGMDTHSLPSFRPDEKGLVEKTMDLIQKRYKYLLRGKGVIEPDARERWAVDYRDQALLDLDEFTAIVLRIIVSLNKSRILENFQPPKEMAKTLSSFTPAHIWHWLEEHGKSTMLNVSEEKFYHYSLPRTTVRVSQRGILFQGLTYNTREVLLTVGKTVEIAYDENDTSCVFLVKKAGGEALFLPIPLAPAMEQYRSVSFMEYTQVRKNLSKQKAKGKQQETQERVSAMADIKNIISNRKGESK